MSTELTTVWGFHLPDALLEADEQAYLSALPENLPEIDWIWSEMDRVWFALGLDNKAPEKQLLQQYYQHPVWIANGIFTARDPVSVAHRRAIANYICASGKEDIADYGGGFGELARTIAATARHPRISVFDPYASPLAIRLSAGNKQIRFVKRLEKESYDFVIAQDILEHLTAPLNAAQLIAESLRQGGIAIIANCFFPIIQCHLPSTFYLRHTFKYIARHLGLHYVGNISGAEHASIFVRQGTMDLSRLRKTDRISQSFGPVINRLCENFDAMKRKLGQ